MNNLLFLFMDVHQVTLHQLPWIQEINLNGLTWSWIFPKNTHYYIQSVTKNMCSQSLAENRGWLKHSQITRHTRHTRQPPFISRTYLCRGEGRVSSRHDTVHIRRPTSCNSCPWTVAVTVCVNHTPPKFAPPETALEQNLSANGSAEYINRKAVCFRKSSNCCSCTGSR